MVDRRTFLKWSYSSIIVFAGCSGPLESDESSDNSPTSASKTDPGCGSLQTVTANSDNQGDFCVLRHKIVSDENDYTILDEYEYTELSQIAQHVFKCCLKVKDMRVDIEYTRDEWPSEFDYSDVMSYYEITYNEETHLLRTWSGGGCSIT